MTGSHGIVDGPPKTDLKKIADSEGFDGNMLFALVGIHGRFAANGGIQFLDVTRGSFNCGAVRFADAYEEDVEILETGAVGINKESEFPDGRLRLHAEAEEQVTLAFAIRLEADFVLKRLNDVGLSGE
jgi:hypothetical protein